MTTPIHITNLSVRAGRREILHLDSLKIEPGQHLGLLGPNGAGKSTLLRCLLAMQSHANGKVSILDKELSRLSFRELAALRSRIGYVPQLLPGKSEIPLTVREVVSIGRTGMAGLCRSLQKPDFQIIDSWINRLGLDSLSARGFSEISGGEQRKTLIARAMVQQPELLLLDEPTANLDLGWRERIVNTIDELSASHKLTIILVCHELEVLPPCCQRIVILDEGRILDDGLPHEVLTSERIASLYGPGMAVLHNAGRWAVVPGEVAHA